MKNALTRSKWFLMGILFAGFFLQAPGLSAGQISRQYAAAYFQSQQLISPEESQLADYRLERAAIKRNLAKGRPSHILKQKLKILNSKIIYLENQLRRSRPTGKPLVKRAAQAPPVIIKPKPVSISQKPAVVVHKPTMNTSDIIFPKSQAPPHRFREESGAHKS